jgi:hypothetical protein
MEESNYQKTAALMCKDFKIMAEGLTELSAENDLLGKIADKIIEEGDADFFHIRNLEKHLAHLSMKLLSLYSRNPGSSHLESLYRRSENLKNMCSDMLTKP